MALRTRVRYKPDMFRSSLEALVMGETGDGTSGTVVLTVQAIQFDDAQVPDINAITFGDPDQEKFINVLLEGSLQFDIPTIAVMTAPNRTNALRDGLDGWALANKGLITAMEGIVRTARRMNARPIP